MPELTHKRLAQWEELCQWLEDRPYNAAYRLGVHAHLTAQAKDYPVSRNGHETHAMAKQIEAERKALGLIFWSTGHGWRLHKDYKEKLAAARARLEAAETQ